MSKAILTIDDAPSEITPQIVDYLRSKGIVPVINFIGSGIAEHFEEAVYVAENDIVIGNHSFSHPVFSKITLDECRNEIMKTEREIDRVYRAANKERKHRVFRFPYGDKGGENAEALQKMLKEEFGFERLDDSEVTVPFWKQNHLDKDIDMLWSFDFVEYELAWNNGFTWDTIVSRIHNRHPEQGAYLLDENSMNIVLMHDMTNTNNVMERYYERIIDYVLSAGVKFVSPRFFI